MALGEVAYPELLQSARAYAEQWAEKAKGPPEEPDFREIRKPAGTKKATIGAMTAVLKPGKSVPATLEDHRWVSSDREPPSALRPCLEFLGELLQVGASP